MLSLDSQTRPLYGKGKRCGKGDKHPAGILNEALGRISLWKGHA